VESARTTNQWESIILERIVLIMKSKGTEFNLLEQLEDYSRTLDKIITIDAEHLNRVVLHRAYVQGRIESLKKATR